jgi:catechol 2,3-dioxygenase-like lactoylglutathione lyase family enzyme
MVRAAIFVRDIDRSAAFYGGVLGMDVTYWEGPLAHPAVPLLLGTSPEASVRARIVQVPGPSFGMVGLFEVTPPPPAVAKRADGVNLGEAVLVFYSADLDPITQRLTAGNHRILCPPTFLQVSPTRGQREMTCADPDGFLVNLIERDERLD